MGCEEGVREERQWRRFVAFVQRSQKGWVVEYWCATMESNAGEGSHAHLMLQFAKVMDTATNGFAFGDRKPNARPTDLCGEGLCRKRLQVLWSTTQWGAPTHIPHTYNELPPTTMQLQQQGFFGRKYARRRMRRPRSRSGMSHHGLPISTQLRSFGLGCVNSSGSRILADFRARRRPLGKTAYKARLRQVMRTKKAQTIGPNVARGFRKTCREVVKKKGAAARAYGDSTRDTP